MNNTRTKKRIIFAFMLLVFVSTISKPLTLTAATKTNKFPKIKIVQCGKLTEKMLTHRKGKNIIYIEVITGQVINNKLDGEITNKGTFFHSYISYKDVEGARKGSRIITYCIYNPYTNYEDDVALRLDFVVRK